MEVSPRRVDELVDKGVTQTGAPDIGGSIVTGGGLVFIGATNDSRFCAFDKDSGKELWVSRPAGGRPHAPMGQTWSKPNVL